MLQLIASVLMSWVMLFWYMHWKPLRAETRDDGTYIHISHVALVIALISAFTVVSWIVLEYGLKGVLT